jgi:hypothetical protein
VSTHQCLAIPLHLDSEPGVTTPSLCRDSCNSLLLVHPMNICNSPPIDRRIDMVRRAVEDQPTHQSVEESSNTETTKVQIKLANATK